MSVVVGGILDAPHVSHVVGGTLDTPGVPDVVGGILDGLDAVRGSLELRDLLEFLGVLEPPDIPEFGGISELPDILESSGIQKTQGDAQDQPVCGRAHFCACACARLQPEPDQIGPALPNHDRNRICVNRANPEIALFDIVNVQKWAAAPYCLLREMQFAIDAARFMRISMRTKRRRRPFVNFLHSIPAGIRRPHCAIATPGGHSFPISFFELPARRNHGDLETLETPVPRLR